MSHLKLGLFALSVCFVACTTENPLYVPETIAGDGGVRDLATASHTDMPSGAKDFATPSTMCTDGERLCSATASEICEAGMLAVDRTCPTSSDCKGGYCQPPPVGQNNVGKSCSTSAGHETEQLCLIGVSGNQNNAPSCQPFVSNSSSDKSISWFCAPRVGPGLAGMPCTNGDVCRSGFCGDNGTCFRACVSVADCPSDGGPGKWKCEQVDITVEGLPASASSCIPGN